MAEVELCTVCNIKLLDKTSRDAHYASRKHQLAMHNEYIYSKRERCGVFISGLPNLVGKEQITKFLNDLGPTKEIYIGDGNKFALVEFNEESVAQELIKKQKLHFMGKTIYLKHRKRKETNDLKEQKELDIDSINNSLKGIQFNEQVKRLISHLQPNQIQLVQHYESLLNDLQNSLQATFKDCKVYPFGSSVTGLNFKYSDVDIFVEVVTKDGETENAQNYIKRARNILPKSRNFSHVVAIPKAKTPIVKSVHIKTQVSCDFNFKNMLGVCNSYLIKHYISLAPQLRTVAMIIKYWALVHELHTSGNKFSNYALIVMLIYYLQQEPFGCETVYEMQSRPLSENLQDGWNGGFMPSILYNREIMITKIEGILEGFFKFYSGYDFSLNVISPYLGKSIPKADFLRPDILCDKFERYKINLVRVLPLQVDTPMCVQDPFEHNHNLTKGVSPKVVDDFKLYCKEAVKIFNNNKQEEGPLYRLFTYEPLDEKFKWNENSCEFRITMGQSLKHLEKQVPLDSSNRSEAIRRLWFEMANVFVIDVLAKVLLCELKVEKTPLKLEDSGISDAVSIRCKTNKNMWDSRRAVRRDIELKNTATNLEKEILVTNYIRDVLCKDIKIDEPIVEFMLTMYARDTPMQVEFVITKVSSMKGCFKHICTFLAVRLPHWFNAHEKELDESAG